MPDPSIDELLGLLPERVEPDPGFEERLRRRLEEELRGDSRISDHDNHDDDDDDEGDEPDIGEVLTLEATTQIKRVRRPGVWLAAAVALVAVMAAALVATRDDSTSTTTATATPSYADAELTTIRVEQGTNPYFVAVAEHAWVASLTGEVTQIGPSGEVLGQLTIPEASPIAADRQAVWVADAVEGDVLRLDPETGELVARIPTGVEVLPFAIRIPMAEGSSRQFSLIGGITSDGTSVWVGDRDGRVLRIDPATNTVAASVDVDVRPDHLSVDADSLLVANLPEGEVVVLDHSSGEELVALTPRDPLAGAALYDRALYLQDEATGVVTRIDLESGAETTSEPLGSAPAAPTQPTLPTGLAVDAAGVLVVTDQGPRSLHVLDPVTLTSKGVLEVPTGRGDVAIAPDGTAWIVRTEQRTVTRIVPAP